MKPYISPGRKNGFTLIETIIAVLIAGSTFIGFLLVCNMSSIMLKDIKSRVRAINIIQAELEGIKALNYDEIDVANFTPYKAVNVIIDYGPTSSPDDDLIGEMRTTIRNAANPPLEGKKIVAEITWQTLGEGKQEIMETVVYSRQ